MKTPLEIVDERGFRKGWVAEQIGTDRSTLSHMFHGQRRWSKEKRSSFAKLVGMDESAIFFDSEITKKYSDTRQGGI